MCLSSIGSSPTEPEGLACAVLIWLGAVWRGLQCWGVSFIWFQEGAEPQGPDWPTVCGHTALETLEGAMTYDMTHLQVRALKSLPQSSWQSWLMGVCG